MGKMLLYCSLWTSIGEFLLRHELKKYFIKMLDILRTKHIVYKMAIRMYVLKTDVNRNLPVMQSNNLHSFSDTVFLHSKDTWIR